MKNKKNENKKNLVILKEFLIKLENEIKNKEQKTNEKLDINKSK